MTSILCRRVERAERTVVAAALALAVVLAAGCARTPSDLPDLGSAELRQRVERLKRDVAAEPTTAANVFERADLLWAWANALGRVGVEIPIDLPLHVALVHWAAADGGEPELPPGLDLPLALHLTRVDHYLRELALREDHPAALGTLAFDRREPLVSGDRVTLVETYTVGEQPVATGGGFLVARAWVADELHLQHQDPAAPNYLTATSSRPGVELEPTTRRWIGVHGSPRGDVEIPGFQVAAGTLEPGDVVTFTLGDTSAGGPGMVVPTFSVDRFIVPIYVDLDGSENFLSSRWPALEIVGRPEVTAVRLTAPSVVAPAEPFTLTVRSEDAAMNRTSGEVPAYELRRGEEVLARLAAGGPALAHIEGVTLERPGIERLEIRSADGRLRAVSNPIRVESDPLHRVLWGETHGHTSLAEGQGTARAFFEYARDDARLDFVTLTEHDFWMHDAEWQQLQELTRDFLDDGRFSPILGYEWSAFHNRGGHHNVFFRRPSGPMVSSTDAHRLPLLYQGLRQRSAPEDVLVIPHAHESGDWSTSDPDLERLVELYSSHGTFEYFANRYLRNGFEVGVVGASDDHQAKPGLAPGPLVGGSQPGGLAAVMAPANTVDAVFDALRARAVYATSGQRILLDATLNGQPIGSRQPAAARREIRARVSGTAPIERIDVVRNGEVVMSRPYALAPLSPRMTVQVALESTSDPLGERLQNPRGYRNWVGELEVEGARLRRVVPLGLDHFSRESATVVEGAPDQVRFRILTRGRADSILLELDGAGPASALHLRLESARGTSSVSSLVPGEASPPIELVIPLAGLRDGRVEHAVPFGPHQDRIWAQAVDPEAAPLDAELTFTDLEGADGDYYYVRVTQLDGARAWSSPFWVGER